MDDDENNAETTVAFERVDEGPWAEIAKQVLPGAAVAAESLARELAAAKELAEVAGVMRSILEIGDLHKVTTESMAESLTDRSSGGINVGVPPEQGGGEGENRGPLGGLPQGTSQTDRHKYRPNLSIGTGGLASQGPTNIGQPTGAHGTRSHGEDGSTTVTRSQKYSSGTTITTSVTYDGNGNTTRVDAQTTNPDGSTNSTGTVQTENGGRIEYEVDADKEGNVTRDEMREFDNNGDPVKENDLAGQPGAQEGSDSDLVDFIQSWHRSVYGPKNFEIKIPAHFNPGTHDPNAGISGPRLKHEGIAVNPDPHSTSGGTINKEAARRMQEELRNKAAGGFGPGPKPPKE